MTGIDWDRCSYCDEPGCLDKTVTHAADCPSVTNLWPIREEDFPGDGRGWACSACDEPFKVGDIYTMVKEDDHWMMANLPPGAAVAGFSVCLGCAALERRSS